ncbi:hypothetical protein PHPALM_3615 [Phytophthora palmivora]|uniref:Uncharacterized protein n=1 Tax=Phytophthora palmivora TaxID=4796 RepID=A0A2P4YLY4_9STRA|nr:hypothetical protein PHPALM_3615 [Phytophthora palmivora]
MEYYRSRCELLETITSGCATCASLSAVQFGDIELLPAEPKIISDDMLNDEVDNENDSTVLTEVECVVLDKVLQS